VGDEGDGVGDRGGSGGFDIGWRAVGVHVALRKMKSKDRCELKSRKDARKRTRTNLSDESSLPTSVNDISEDLGRLKMKTSVVAACGSLLKYKPVSNRSLRTRA